MPARDTLISTCPSPGSGTGTSATLSTSGPPNSSIWTARMGGRAYPPRPMSLVVVGSIAFDAVRTPFGERERMLGGSAVHFSLAASFFTEVRVVGPVGEDFGPDELSVLEGRGVITEDIERVDGGRTFFWRGHYDYDLNVAHTDDTQLNVFGDFEPKLSDESKGAESVFLANIQ